MRHTLLLSAVVMASLCVGGAANAQASDIGKTLYGDYCSACHGMEGKGDGEMAMVLTVKPPNLTLLSQRNNGAFPMLKVIHIIDGRTGVRAHGGQMPVWGQTFSDMAGGAENPVGSVIEARGKVMSLATYLESIQQ